MVQPAANGVRGGKNPLGITAFWPSENAKPPVLWEHWINKFTWDVIAKHAFIPTSYYFLKTSRDARRCWGKTWSKRKKTLISNMYLCFRELGQDELHNRKLETVFGFGYY